MFESIETQPSNVIHNDFRSQKRKSEAVSASKINMRRITGLAPMSRVTTNFGEVYAHVLREGDRVRTVSGQFQRVVRVDRLRLDEGFMSLYPEAHPIRLRKGALGPGLPREDMMVAPYQKVRVGPPRSQSPTVFAADLLGRPFVQRTRENQITYTNVVLEGPGQILCEGIAVDSENG